MRLGAITVMQNIRILVAEHENKTDRGLIGLNSCKLIDLRCVSMYVRAGVRFFPGIGRAKTVEIARIEVPARYRGRGFFKRVIKETEDVGDLTDRIIYVESILNPDLLSHLMDRRVGYARMPDLCPILILWCEHV